MPKSMYGKGGKVKGGKKGSSHGSHKGGKVKPMAGSKTKGSMKGY